MQVESRGVKNFHATRASSWNRRLHPFLGCYYQRGDIVKLNHEREVMIDGEHVMCHKNVADECECELSVNPDHSAEDHKDWCAKNNFVVNNFGLDPAFLPASKTRYEVGLHVPFATLLTKTQC